MYRVGAGLVIGILLAMVSGIVLLISGCGSSTYEFNESAIDTELTTVVPGIGEYNESFYPVSYDSVRID